MQQMRRRYVWPDSARLGERGDPAPSGEAQKPERASPGAGNSPGVLWGLSLTGQEGLTAPLATLLSLDSKQAVLP